MSLYEHLKNIDIGKEHIYTASMTDPTDFPRKVGHDTKIDTITEDLARTTISDEECYVYMYCKKYTNYDSQNNTLRSAIYL